MHSNETNEVESNDVETNEVEKVEIEDKGTSFDPSFPYGHPSSLDYSDIDLPIRDLIKEINLRPWCKTTESCSGHPMDRDVNENTVWGPSYRSPDNEEGRWNYYERLIDLESQVIKKVLERDVYLDMKEQLRTMSATNFYLNVNVYDIHPFSELMRSIHSTVLSLNRVLEITESSMEIIFNAYRPSLNFTILFKYYTLAERQAFLEIFKEALRLIPV